MQCLVVYHGKCRRALTFTDKLETKEIVSSFLPENESDVYIISNGRKVSDDDILQDGCVYHVIPRLRGGKGGFGSMLRAIGAQIDKTNNREACRDLSGRRMRDVNNEKQMKEWLSKQAEKEKEREERRRERWERRKAMPNHKFDDPLYDQQKALVSENLEDALQKGLVKSRVNPAASSTATSATTSTEGSRKRKADQAPGPANKVRKNIEWLGIDVDNLSDLDSDEGEGQSDVDEGQSNVTAGACARPVDSLNDDSRSNQSASSYSHDVESDQSSSSDLHDNISNSNKAENKTTEMNCQEKYIIPLESNVEDHEENMDFQIRVEKSNNVVGISEKERDEESSCNNETQSEEKVKREERLEKEETPRTEDVVKEEPASTESCDQSANKSIAADNAYAEPESAKSETFTLDDCNSAEELEDLGLDKLKAELMSRGLKCGGTLTERAQRLYSVKGLTLDQIDPALYAKPSKGKKKK